MKLRLFIVIVITIVLCNSPVVAQLGGPPTGSGRLITPQQRRIPINWFRKPFGQMRKEIMTREMKRTQFSVTSIRIPPNVSPLSRFLNFSSYSISSALGVRRRRTLSDPDASLRLNSWFYLRRGERERTQWWESNIRSLVIRGMVFQPRFEGVLGNASGGRGGSMPDPPIDILRNNVLRGGSRGPLMPVSSPAASIFRPPVSSAPVPLEIPPKSEKEVVPKEDLSEREEKKDIPSRTGILPPRVIKPSPSGDLGPRRPQHRNVSPLPSGLL